MGSSGPELSDYNGSGALFVERESDLATLCSQADEEWIELYNSNLRFVFFILDSESLASAHFLHLKAVSEALNHLTEQISAPPLQIEILDPTEFWARHRLSARAKIQVEKRRLFAPFLQWRNSAQLQASHLPHSAHFDEDSCTGCLDCQRVCPVEALKLRTDDKSAALAINPYICNGCRLCESICQPHAIRVELFTTQASTALALKTQTCLLCRRTFYQPQGKSNDCCAICEDSRRQSSNNLFKHLKGDLRVFDN